MLNTKTDLSSLNDQQREAVTSESKRLLVLAGAGSGEERRLFYVAITRAKDELFLITEKGNESSFIKEIPEIFTSKTFIPFKSVVEKLLLCTNCECQLEKNFKFCPACGCEVNEV